MKNSVLLLAVESDDVHEYDENANPFWIYDEDLGEGEIIPINKDETMFFKVNSNMSLIQGSLGPFHNNF